MVKSVNSKKTIKKIQRGLSIYRTGRSPFWHARIYDPVKKKYVVRSTKETNRIEAIEVETTETRGEYLFAEPYEFRQVEEVWSLNDQNDDDLIVRIPLRLGQVS